MSLADQEKTVLPSGGSLGIEPAVAESFLCHIEGCCAPDGSAREAAAFDRRDQLLRLMDAVQRGYVAMVAMALLRLVE